MLAVLLIHRLSCFLNCIPACVNLEVGRNNAIQFARNGRRKRRLDCTVTAGGAPPFALFCSRHRCPPHLSSRRFNTAQLPGPLHPIPPPCFSFTPHPPA